MFFTLRKTLLWKDSQRCICNFRENWGKKNFTIWHTIPRFNPWLFTILVKSKVAFRLHFLILRDRRLIALWHGFYLLNKGSCKHLSLNTDTGKNFIKEISLILHKKPRWLGKILYFLRSHNGSKNMFVNESEILFQGTLKLSVYFILKHFYVLGSFYSGCLSFCK